MARRPRLRIANHPFHIVQRGVDRKPCFREPTDYRLYLGLLQELSEVTRCGIHAYVLMTNHVHLLLTPADPDGCSALMKHLAQRYSQHFNREWKRTGPLWEGRFKSCLVDSHGYGLRCQRYIEMNPVRAGMVRNPGDYRWSSHLANGHGEPSTLLTPQVAFQALSDHPDERRRIYREMCREDETSDELARIRSALGGCVPLGSREFVARLETTLRCRVSRRRAGRQRCTNPER